MPLGKSLLSSGPNFSGVISGSLCFAVAGGNWASGKLLISLPLDHESRQSFLPSSAGLVGAPAIWSGLFWLGSEAVENLASFAGIDTVLAPVACCTGFWSRQSLECTML